MNFEHYLDNNRPNPKRAAMLTFAAAIALTGTTMMLAAGWVAGKMSIARVEPPSTEYILLSLSAEQPPPPPPPPPPLGTTAEEDEVKPDTDDVVPEEPEPIEDTTQPEMPTKIPAQKAGSTQVGVPNGVLGGQPNGIIGGIPIGKVPIGGLGIAVKPPTKDVLTVKPLAMVMARSVYTPDPDMKLLQQTKAARFDKRNGKATISFCIDGNGGVVNVKTKGKFPGDPQVDAILRRTIENWRFKPLEVGSKKMKTCTQRTFSLKFQ